MKKLLIIIFLFFSLNINKASSWEFISGVGATDCGKFLSEIESNNYLETLYFGYILGSIDSKRIRDFADTKGSNEAIKLMVINHCKSNPLDEVWEAVNKVYKQLPSRS